MNDASQHYALRIDLIEADREELSATRRLATRLREKTYLTVGQVLGDLSLQDMRHILVLSKAVTPDGKMDWENVKRAYIFGLLMVSAEGGVSLTPDNTDEYVNWAWQLLALEIMSRRGFIDFDSAKVSFLDDGFDYTIKPAMFDEMMSLAQKFQDSTKDLKGPE